MLGRILYRLGLPPSTCAAPAMNVFLLHPFIRSLRPGGKIIGTAAICFWFAFQYAALLAALHDKDDHTRLMAVRHLIGFKPFDGGTVGDQVVDIRGELVHRLRDRSAYVRVEVPFLLAEADVEGLQELLRPVAKRDLKKKVRRAARDVLEYLGEA